MNDTERLHSLVPTSDRHNVHRCAGHLAHIGAAFHSDVQWEKFVCADCYRIVYLVGGRSHWWNYDREPEPEERGQIARALRRAAEPA